MVRSARKILAEIARLHLEDVIECPGFVPWPQLEASISRATGLILPSEREGYGSVVIEAIARGTPAIVVRGSDNAATDLIVENVNGFVAPSVEPSVLAEHMVKLYVAGPELRARTHQWYRRACVATEHRCLDRADRRGLPKHRDASKIRMRIVSMLMAYWPNATDLLADRAASLRPSTRQLNRPRTFDARLDHRLTQGGIAQ